MDAPAIPADAPSFMAISGALALELASQLSPPSDIFARHGISEADAVKILADPTFQSILKEAHAEWKADQNVSDRIRLKSQMCLEELLLPTFHVAKDPRVPPPARLDATKLFERLSGVTKSSDDSGGHGPKFVLTIQVGNSDNSPKEIEGEVITDAEV